MLHSNTPPEQTPFTVELVRKQKLNIPVTSKEVYTALMIAEKGSDTSWVCWDAFEAMRNQIPAKGDAGYMDVMYATAQIATHLLMPAITALHIKHDNARIRTNVNDDFRSNCREAIVEALKNYDPTVSHFVNHVAPYLRQQGLIFNKDQSHYLQKKFPVNIVSADAKVSDDENAPSGIERTSSDYSLVEDVIEREESNVFSEILFIAHSKGLLSDRETDIVENRNKAEESLEVLEEESQMSEESTKALENAKKTLEKASKIREREVNENILITAKLLGGIQNMPAIAREKFTEEFLMAENDVKQREEEE